jgi:Ca2+-binding EF-hand superfamily protein
MSVANLTRYDIFFEARVDGLAVVESSNGEFVKFEDVVEAYSNSVQQLKSENATQNCDHVFDVYNHGEVECRICKKRYQLGWALDKQKDDNAELKCKDCKRLNGFT